MRHEAPPGGGNAHHTSPEVIFNSVAQPGKNDIIFLVDFVE
jgi:hypothetical protein